MLVDPPLAQVDMVLSVAKLIHLVPESSAVRLTLLDLELLETMLEFLLLQLPMLVVPPKLMYHQLQQHILEAQLRHMYHQLQQPTLEAQHRHTSQAQSQLDTQLQGSLLQELDVDQSLKIFQLRAESNTFLLKLSILNMIK